MIAKLTPQNQPEESPAPSVELERQRAFTNYELLTDIALRCPTSQQSLLLDEAFADHQFAIGATADPTAAQHRAEHRSQLLGQLAEQIVTLDADWSDNGLTAAGKRLTVSLARGLPRHVLVRLRNTTDASLNLTARQAGLPHQGQRPYTVLPGERQSFLVRLQSEDPEASSVAFVFTHGSDTRSFETPVEVNEPAVLRGLLLDAESGTQQPGRLYVAGSDHQYRRGERYRDIETLCQKELLRFWQLGKYYQLPFFYSDGDFEVRVPPGEVKVTLERGFEHEIVERSYHLEPGETREVQLTSSRFASVQQRGWVSGDTHVHWVINQWDVDLPLELLSIVQRAEDLRVANNLTLLQRGPTKAFINPQQAPMGTIEEHSDSEYHIEMGEEYRNENLYGHLCFLNLDWLVQPIGTGSIIAGPDALDYPLNKTAILACREQGGISIEAHGLGGNKDVPANVAQGLTDSIDQIFPEEYYNFLECGFHLPLTNGSDHPARVLGSARAYVKVDGDFTYEKWIEGIRQCRTFTTSGPLVSLSVNDADIGDTLLANTGDALKITARVESRRPVEVLQIVSNNEVIAEKRIDSCEGELLVTIPADESRWVVARCGGIDCDFNAIWTKGVAHTSAVYIDVEGEPRFNPDAAELWITRLRAHIRDIRAKGAFANDSQRDEAVRYVEKGIEKYEQLIDSYRYASPSPERSGAAVSKKLEPSRVAGHSSDEECKRCVDNSRHEEVVLPEASPTGAVRNFSGAVEFVKSNKPAPAWPDAPTVDAQPLLLLTDRLIEALDYIGNPLPNETKQSIRELREIQDDTEITKRIQELLDPHCMAAVEIKDGTITASPGGVDRQLVEQGWRSFLVKVCNKARASSRLRIESPNARSMPHAKAEDVASRWMGLTSFDGRPMQAGLSGLPLEYRIVQIYSRDAGENEASLEFSIDAKPGSRGRQIQEWRFDKGTAGWKAANQTNIEARDGSLHVESLGSDPFITAESGGASGDLLLRFWAEAEHDGVAQIFFWTEEQPSPDPNKSVNIPLMPGSAQQYEAAIKVDGVLAGVRIDPNVKAGHTRIDWIDLSYAHRRGETWTSLPMRFVAAPAVEVAIRVEDKHEGANAAAFIIRDKLGRIYPEQSKRLAPDLFFQPQVYRLDGETITLPPGEYSVEAWRGPESFRKKTPLVIGTEPATITHRVRRWIDPADHGWWSGDHHIHAAGCLHYQNPTQGIHPPDMMRQIMGEDLHVGCCLTWGPCFDYQKRFFTGDDHDMMNYPYTLRYDVEVSGFGSHASGHLNLLRLTEQIYPGGDSKDHWPTLGLNTLRWAKAQGAVCGTAHSAAGLTRYVDNLGIEDGPKGLPHYNVPAFDGIGANEFIADVTHELPGPDGEMIPALDFIATMNTPRLDEWNIWYHTLNCGYRVRASGETDFPCMSGERVGIGRVYVGVEGELNYPDWVQALQDGRSYVSDAKSHLLDFRAKHEDKLVELGVSGSEIRIDGAQTLRFSAECASLINHEQNGSDSAEVVDYELIVNGYPVDTVSLPADGELRTLHFEAPIEKSSWVALRAFPHAHTNPIFVLVDGKPIRASKASAEWCLRSVDQCWRMKRPSYKLEEMDDAHEAYQHARRAYQRILAEAVE